MVGHPKTGNTWTRVMLGHYVKRLYSLERLPVFDVAEMSDLVRDGYAGPVGELTHQPLVWRGQTAADLNHENTIAPFVHDRVVFLTRHPLDTLVSNFMHCKYNVPEHNRYPGELSDFVVDPVYGLDKFIRFHQLWAEHHRDVREFLLWRYEDLRAEPQRQLETLLNFLQTRVDAPAIAAAVEAASFENMREMEASGNRPVYQSSGFSMFGRGPKDTPNAFHVRKGKIGGYRGELPADLIAPLEARIQTELPRFFGY